MRVYYRPGTGRPVRVAWLLEELQVPYEAKRPAFVRAAAATESSLLELTR